MAAAIAEPSALGGRPEGATSVDGRSGVAGPGGARPSARVRRRPTSWRSLVQPGGDRTPGARHPAPRPGRPPGLKTLEAFSFEAQPDLDGNAVLQTTGGSSRLAAAKQNQAPAAGKKQAIDDADPGCRAQQHDRVLAGVKARRFAPPRLRGADGLGAGCAHGPRRPCPTARKRSEKEGRDPARAARAASHRQVARCRRRPDARRRDSRPSRAQCLQARPQGRRDAQTARPSTRTGNRDS